MRSTPRPPHPPAEWENWDDIDVWERGWAAGFRAALRSVTTEQLALAVDTTCAEADRCVTAETCPNYHNCIT